MATIPIHQRIRDELVACVESGSLGGRERLPSEAELAQRYGVTRMTVRQALSAMVNDGLLVRRRGVGTFVAENARNRRNMSRLTGFAEEMAHDGRSVQTRILDQRIVPASAEIAAALGLDEGVHTTHLGRVRAIEGVPTIVQHSWLPYDLDPELWHRPLLDSSLYATLREQGIELRRADQRFAAVPATKELAKQLDVAARTPLLRIERVTLDDRNIAVELARSWMRPGVEAATHIER